MRSATQSRAAPTVSEPISTSSSAEANASSTNTTTATKSNTRFVVNRNLRPLSIRRSLADQRQLSRFTRPRARAGHSGTVSAAQPSGAVRDDLGERRRRTDNVGVSDDVEQGDGLRGQCRLQRRRQFAGVAHGVAFGAEAPCVTGEVHLPYLDAGRAAERSLLVHRYGAVQPVAEDHYGDGGAVPDRRLDLLARHQEPAVAAAGHDGPVGSGELRRHSGRNAVTHRAVRGSQLRSGVIVVPVTVNKDREVPRVVGQQGVLGQGFAHCDDDARGVDTFLALVRGYRAGVEVGSVTLGPVTRRG